MFLEVVYVLWWYKFGSVDFSFVKEFVEVLNLFHFDLNYNFIYVVLLTVHSIDDMMFIIRY